MKARIGGAWRDITGGRVRIGGTWRTLVSAKVYTGGAWRDAVSFVQPMTFSVSPESIGRFVQIPDTFVSQSAVGTPTGGRSPFTYAWSRISGDTSFTITSPSSPSTTFSRFVSTEETFTATFQCTCTDANGTALSDTVIVSVTGIDLTFP